MAGFQLRSCGCWIDSRCRIRCVLRAPTEPHLRACAVDRAPAPFHSLASPRHLAREQAASPCLPHLAPPTRPPSSSTLTSHGLPRRHATEQRQPVPGPCLCGSGRAPAWPSGGGGACRCQRRGGAYAGPAAGDAGPGGSVRGCQRGALSSGRRRWVLAGLYPMGESLEETPKSGCTRQRHPMRRSIPSPLQPSLSWGLLAITSQTWRFSMAWPRPPPATAATAACPTAARMMVSRGWDGCGSRPCLCQPFACWQV